MNDKLNLTVYDNNNIVFSTTLRVYPQSIYVNIINNVIFFNTILL